MPNFINPDTRASDPLGKVFIEDGKYFRAIYPSQIELLEGLMKSSAVSSLMENDFLVETRISPKQLSNFGAVVESNAVPFHIPIEKQSFETLRLLASRWIEINLILLEEDLCLIDGHSDNFAFDEFGKPVWVDFGSISILKSGAEGIEEFVELILRPLSALAKHPELSRLIRSGMYSAGLSLEELQGMSKWPIPKFRGREFSSAMYLALLKTNVSPKMVRKAWLKSLIKALPKSAKLAPKGKWSHYAVQSLGEGKFSNQRLQAITKVIDEINPSSILDVGCSDGYFLSMLPSLKCQQIAVEPDDFALSKFAEFVRNQNKGNNKYRAISELDTFHTTSRKAELVLALALTHHVVLADGYDFDYVSERLSTMSNKYVIVEFMPNGMGGLVPQSGLPIWYEINNFISSLKNKFKIVEVIASFENIENSNRVMVFCEK